MRFRFCYSLRTLLLASVFAGSVMMVWRVHEPWTLRTWPLFPKCESNDVNLEQDLLRDMLDMNGNPYDIEFSPTDQFAVISPSLGDYHFLQNREHCNILDLGSAQVCDALPIKGETFWHPTQDVLVHRSGDWARCVQYPGGRELTEIAVPESAQLSFTETGRWLKQRLYFNSTGTSVLHFYDTRNWKSVHTFGCDPNAPLKSHAVSSDDCVVALCSPSYEFNDSKSAPHEISLTEIESNKTLWHWLTPEAFNFCSVHFTRDESALTVTGSDTDSHLRIEYKVGLNSGEVLERKSEVHYPRCAGWKHIDLRKRTAMSPDGKWTCRIAEKATYISLEENSTRREIARLEAGGERIEPPLKISANKRRVTASINDRSLGVWTMNRTHSEWWGLYERPEAWLALALFAALMWSGISDWRTKAR